MNGLVLIKFVCVMKRAGKTEDEAIIIISFTLLYCSLALYLLCSAVVVAFSLSSPPQFFSLFFARFWWSFLLPRALSSLVLLLHYGLICMLAKKHCAVRKHTKNLHKFITLYVAELTLRMTWFNVCVCVCAHTNVCMHIYYMLYIVCVRHPKCVQTNHRFYLVRFGRPLFLARLFQFQLFTIEATLAFISIYAID